MHLRHILNVVRRRSLVTALVFIGIIAAYEINIHTEDAVRHTATTGVMIAPDPIYKAGSSIFSTAAQYLSFGAKLESISSDPVVIRAAELIRGDRSFESKVFWGREYTSSIESEVERARAEYGDGESGIRRLQEELRAEIAVTQVPRRQLADVRVEGRDESEARFRSWAIAEAGYQFHRERARNGNQRNIVALDIGVSEAEANTRAAFEALDGACRRMGIIDPEISSLIIREAIRVVDARDASYAAELRTLRRELTTRLEDGGALITKKLADARHRHRDRTVAREVTQARLDLEVKKALYTEDHPELRLATGHLDRLRGFAREHDEQVQELALRELQQDTQRLLEDETGVNRERRLLAERRQDLYERLELIETQSAEIEPLQGAYDDALATLRNLRTFRNNAEWSAGAQLSPVTVESPAKSSLAVIKGSRGPSGLLLVVIIGALFSVGTALLIEHLDHRVRTEEEVEQQLDLPILAAIPRRRGQQDLREETLGHGLVPERFRMAAILCRRLATRSDLRSVMIASACNGEGRSTTAVHLAVGLSRLGSRVLLVDADLRSPSLHRTMSIPNSSGLTTALANRARRLPASSPASADGLLRFVQPSGLTRLEVLPSGPVDAESNRLMSPDRMAGIIKDLSGYYDFIIVDAPPVHEGGDALAVASATDAVLFVVGMGGPSREEVRVSKQLLANIGANIIGGIINKQTGERADDYYYARTEAPLV